MFDLSEPIRAGGGGGVGRPVGRESEIRLIFENFKRAVLPAPVEFDWSYAIGLMSVSHYIRAFHGG